MKASNQTMSSLKTNSKKERWWRESFNSNQREL